MHLKIDWTRAKRLGTPQGSFFSLSEDQASNDVLRLTPSTGDSMHILSATGPHCFEMNDGRPNGLVAASINDSVQFSCVLVAFLLQLKSIPYASLQWDRKTKKHILLIREKEQRAPCKEKLTHVKTLV